MTANPNVLNVHNQNEQVLFLGEIEGQLSDGQWENMRPWDHWRIWCNVNVQIDSDNVGRNFYATKDNYNLTNHDLLEAVGYRMVWLVKLTQVSYPALRLVLDGAHWDLFEDAEEYYEACSANAPQYMKDKLSKLTALGITGETYDIAAQYKYDMKDLRKDLKGLSNAMKTAR